MFQPQSLASFKIDTRDSFEEFFNKYATAELKSWDFSHNLDKKLDDKEHYSKKLKI